MNSKLVLGNPGTGKTYNLVQLINGFLDRGYEASDITVLSHTRGAAREIARRASSSGVRASTIHSMAYSLADIIKEQVISHRELKEFSENIGVPMKGGNTISDAFLEEGDEYIAIINYAASCCMPLSWAYNEKNRPGTLSGFEHFCINYSYWKKEHGFIDFNDMLDLAIRSNDSPTLPVLLIDEAQDLSKQQWKLINEVIGHTAEMIVTGDPDQALFTWGGAEPKLMLKWAKDNKAEITELSQSYRVPKAAYEMSMSIIHKIKDRYEKFYLPTDIPGSINRFLSVNHYDFDKLENALILYRNHALRKEIEQELIFCNKAYKALNGPTSPCYNKYGMGVKAWINIQKSEFPDKKDINKIKSIATPILLKAIRDNDLDLIKSMKGVVALNIPYEMFKYYQYVDFSKADNIQLSTIHGAKGMEHDMVILINGTTQRVLEGAVNNPDPEYQVWYVAVTRTKNKLHIIDGDNAIL